MDKMHVFLDTDIGTDVDDALALAVLLGSPEVQLVGISTVYGDTQLRAQLAVRLSKLSPHPFATPVAAGLSKTRSGRPVWWPGHEGALHNGLEDEPIEQISGVQLLLNMAREHHSELNVLAIGPLTNIAAALDHDPDFEAHVRTLVIMGGDFTNSNRRAEHNFLSDVSAAQRVFNSRIPIVVGGLDLTTQIRLETSDVDAIAASGPLGHALNDEIAEWWKFNGHPWNNPHDPILAAWLLKPALFQTRQASINISSEGYSLETDAPGSPRATILTTMQVPEVVDLIVSRICNASTPEPSGAGS